MEIEIMLEATKEWISIVDRWPKFTAEESALFREGFLAGATLLEHTAEHMLRNQPASQDVEQARYVALQIAALQGLALEIRSLSARFLNKDIPDAPKGTMQ